MTPTSQILGINASGTPPTGGMQTTSSASPVDTQGFSALLEILASLMTGNGTVQSSATQNGQAVAQPTDQPPQASSSSATSSGNSTVAVLERQLAAILSGCIPAKQAKDPAGNLQMAAEYSPAGFQGAFPYPSSANTQSQSDTSNGTQPSLPGLTQAMLPQAEMELASLLEQYQLSATQGGSSAGVANITQPSSSFESPTANPTGLAGQGAVSPAIRNELTNLLSIASGSTPDPKAFEELSAILAGMGGNDAVSQQEIFKRLQASGPAVASVQLSEPGSQGNSVSTFTATHSVQGQTLSQQLILAADKTVPQSIGTTVSAPQGNSTTTLASQSNGTTASTVQPTSLNITGTVEPAASQGSTVASANSGTGSASAESGTASQVSNRSTSATSAQAGQIQVAETGQGNQSSAGSDKGSADLLRTDASQAYIAAASPQRVSSTFQQTLSAVSQNQPAVPAKPDALQLAQSIVKEVNLMSQQGKTIVNMKLEPESLGSVTLQVSSEGGKISAQFDVKTADARAYLEASVPEIRQALETNGVSVSHLGVNLSGGELPAGNQKFGYQPKRQAARYYSSQASAPISAAAPETLRNFGYNTMEMQL